MDENKATRAFGALSHERRLTIFRMLVRAGSGGLPAGAISHDLAVPHNTLSSHLATLVSAGLVRSRRDGRSIIYSIDFHGTRTLLGFLLEDCCQGQSNACTAALDTTLADCG
jgi:ArsR family transcriptional regulator